VAEADLRVALTTVVAPSDIQAIILPSNKGFVHLNSDTAKAKLLAQRKFVVKDEAASAVADSVSPSVRVALVVSISSLPPKTTSSQVYKVFSDQGIACNFVTVRKGHAYVELKDELSYQKAIQLAHINFNSTLVSL
jgi:hypothetical protein